MSSNKGFKCLQDTHSDIPRKEGRRGRRREAEMSVLTVFIGIEPSSGFGDISQARGIVGDGKKALMIWACPCRLEESDAPQMTEP